MSDWTMEDVMGFLAPHIDDLDQIPRIALAKYRAGSPDVLLEHDTRAQAACIYCHMVAEADRRLSIKGGVVSKEINGLKVWLIGDKVMLRLKKMDKDGQSRNYPTKQARDYDLGGYLPGLPLAAVRVSAGYLLNPTQTEIVRVQIARPNGLKRVQWCTAIVPANVNAQRWIDVTRQRGII